MDSAAIRPTIGGRVLPHCSTRLDRHASLIQNSLFYIRLFASLYGR
jgi:hypothetical protein